MGGGTALVEVEPEDHFLPLELFPSGTLRGYYHTSYYKLYIPVAGGRERIER
jgi:hypothetical protein